MSWRKVVVILAILIILMTGFSVRVNDFHYEFRGFASILLDTLTQR